VHHLFYSLLLVLSSSCAFLTLVIDQQEASRLLAPQAICTFFQICFVLVFFFLPTLCSIIVLYICIILSSLSLSFVVVVRLALVLCKALLSSLFSVEWHICSTTNLRGDCLNAYLPVSTGLVADLVCPHPFGLLLCLLMKICFV
jgi:hypothetical protein